MGTHNFRWSLLILIGELQMAPLAISQVMDSPSTINDHSVSMTIALEPELTTILSYQYHVDRQNIVGVSVKKALLISGSHRLNLTYGRVINVSSEHQVLLWALPYMAYNKNRAGTMTGLGMELRGSWIKTSGRWSRGLDLGYQATLFNHIKHSEITRETFKDRYAGEAGPVDGWYFSTAHRFRLGFLMAHTIKNKMIVQFNLGTLFNYQKQGLLLSFPHGQVPIYFETSLLYAW
jgi:hypothetical protein